MPNSFFDVESLNMLENTKFVTEVNGITNSLNKKKGYFQGLLSQSAILHNYDLFSSKFSEYVAAYDSNNQTILNVQRSNPHDKKIIIPLLEKSIQITDDFYEFSKTIIQNENIKQDVDAVKIEVLKEIEGMVSDLKKEVKLKLVRAARYAQIRIDTLASNAEIQIETGIKNLVDLKAEFGLAKSFGDKLIDDYKRSVKARNIFMTIFVLNVALVPCFIWLVSSNFEGLKENLLEVSGSVAMLFTSYFFFSQYKLNQMLSLRYSHLNGFIGGGATFLSKLIESNNEDIKMEVNKKLANLFMEMEDITGMIKRNKHPGEISLEKISEFLKRN